MSYIVKHNKEKYLIMESGDKRPLGKSIQYFLRKSIMIFFGLISLVLLIGVVSGSSLTNYLPLKETFKIDFIVLSMSIGITVAFVFIKFLEKVTISWKILDYLIMVLSTYLAITTVSMINENSKEFAEKEIQNDKIAITYYENYKSLDNKYNRAQALYDSCWAIGWADGAKGWRLQAQALEPQVNLAFSKYENYITEKRNAILTNGGKVQKASLAFMSFIPISFEGIKTSQMFLLSIINDLLIKFFAFIVHIIFPKYTTIRLPKRQNNWLESFIGRLLALTNGSSKFISILATLNIVKISQKESRAETIAGIIAIQKYHLEENVHKHRKLSYTKIGKDVADNIGRREAFSKGWVCKAVNGKLNHLLIS
jgi:hypothetical protein